MIPDYTDLALSYDKNSSQNPVSLSLITVERPHEPPESLSPQYKNGPYPPSPDTYLLTPTNISAVFNFTPPKSLSTGSLRVFGQRHPSDFARALHLIGRILDPSQISRQHLFFFFLDFLFADRVLVSGREECR